MGGLLMTPRLSSWLACVRALYAAQLRQAQQDARSALALAKQIGTYTPSEGYLYYCLFVVSYAWNRLEEASDWLAQLLRLAPDWQHMELLVVGGTWAAQLGVGRGDLSPTEKRRHRVGGLL